MRIARTLIFALVALTLVGASVASAQQPYIGVFFNRVGTPEQKNCPGVGLVDSLFFIAYNFNTNVVGIEFKVNYPASMSWVADLETQPVTIGTTPTGMSMGWALPQNGFSPIFVSKALIQWNCGNCAVPDDPIQVVQHPFSGAPTPQFTQWPTITLHPAIGLTALVCRTVPVEDTTWGRVKSLYSE
ncbi:MAG: hypothetical protein ACE5EO_00850 [Candidatus Krumholzibacteriia bacterium]